MVEGGEGAEAEALAEGGLADQDEGEGGGGVHLGVGEQSELFELVGVEEVGFVDDEHDPSSPFGDFGGEGVGGLGDEGAAVEAGDPAEAGDDGGVEARGRRWRGCRGR